MNEDWLQPNVVSFSVVVLAIIHARDVGLVVCLGKGGAAFEVSQAWPVTKALHVTMLGLGRMVDSCYRVPVLGGSFRNVMRSPAFEKRMPYIAIKLSGVLVVHKPPFWEVNNQQPVGAACVRSWLSKLLVDTSCLLTNADWDQQVYFAHRLDAPCSGLLLVGQHVEVCYVLQW